MDDNVYVVFGSTGEYSDHQYWTVAAYMTEEEAWQHANTAQARYHELAREHKKGRYDRLNDVENEFDPNMRSDYTGTDYTVESVPLKIWEQFK